MKTVLVQLLKRRDRADMPKNPAAVALGRLGGLERARVLTPAQRVAIGRKAVLARWAKRKSSP